MTTQERILVVTVISLFCMWAFGLTRVSSSSSKGDSADEQAIRQLNEDCLKAHDVGDASTLDRIEDADFTLSGDFGIVNKRQHLDRVQKRTSKPEVITRKIDSQQFRFFNGIALVTETDRPTTAEGTFAFQSTEVWVHRHDSWKLLHLHYSQVEQKQ
jgi:hypothetical protein